MAVELCKIELLGVSDRDNEARFDTGTGICDGLSVIGADCPW